MTQSKGRIFLISHNFPPTSGPESSLVKLNAESLYRAGWGVRVLTTTQMHSMQALDFSLLRSLPEGLIVDRVASPEAVVTNKLPKIGRPAAVFLGRYILPEIFLPWMFPATAYGLNIINEWNPHVLYSRATKHVSNVVGWRLKKRTGLPWVAHFSDPWMTGGLYKRPLQRLIGHYFEKRILRDADALVFVTRKAADGILSATHRVDHERVHVIPHGYESLNEELVGLRSQMKANRMLRVIHAGAFYPNMRSPDTLIEALRRLQSRRSLVGRLEVTCIGVDTTCYQSQVDAAGLGDVLKLEAGVSFDVCQRRVATSDLILIIDTPGFGGIFLPTKLIEAFAYKVPVFGLAEKDSAVADVLRGIGLDFSDLNNPDDIACRITELLEKWENGGWGLTELQLQKMSEYHIDQVNRPLLQIFDDLALL